jgi:hypothetical protein
VCCCHNVAPFFPKKLESGKVTHIGINSNGNLKIPLLRSRCVWREFYTPKTHAELGQLSAHLLQGCQATIQRA